MDCLKSPSTAPARLHAESHLSQNPVGGLLFVGCCLWVVVGGLMLAGCCGELLMVGCCGWVSVGGLTLLG